MSRATRRQFVDCVGRGMLAAGLGTSLCSDLGLSPAFAADGSDELSFGDYDELVDLLQSMEPAKLQPILIQRLNNGQVTLRQLTAAAALANAESFGGEDYVGFHTAMAMLPALGMAEALPTGRRPLPVLKVLYRNSSQIQELGGAAHKTLRPLPPHHQALGSDAELRLRNAARRADLADAETTFSGLHEAGIDEIFNTLQPLMQDDVNVHRFVLAHRTRGLANLLGTDYAFDILRQCVRFCINHEQGRLERDRPESPIRALMPRLLDQYGLAGKSFGNIDPGDAWVDSTSQAIYRGPRERSAEIVAAAIADGIDPEVIGEAVSLASNLLTLKQGADKWRTHGDAAGVHASDATNAWRNMARVAETRHAVPGLILAAYHSASHNPFDSQIWPLEEHRATIETTDAAQLLAVVAESVRENDQGRAAAAVAVYGEQNYPLEPLLDSLLRFTVSEDGRLHGEKYYQTVVEEFSTIRPAFRWRQVVGLARVTASAYGYDRFDQHGDRAPGYAQACQLLGVDT